MMSDDLIEQLQRKLDYVERCAAANEKERNEARARLEQAERERAHWRLAALMSRREGFRAGIEAAARLCDAEMDRLYDGRHEGYGAGLYDEAEGLATDIRAMIDTPAPSVAEDCRRWLHYPIIMPLTKDGQGPATVGEDAASITFEVWDRLNTSHGSYEYLADAINEAMRLNALAAQKGE